MEKYFNNISIILGVIGGVLANWLGGWDMLLTTIMGLMIIDCLTGLLKGAITKQLSSKVGFIGLGKKFLIIAIIAGAQLIDRFLGGSIPLREIVITFYIANEGLSLIENAAEIIPIPEKLKSVLLQLREKSDTDND